MDQVAPQPTGATSTTPRAPRHERDDPCALRNHPRASLDYDEAKALTVEAEDFEDSGGAGL